MGGIQGIGGINGPSPERPADVRDKKRDDVKLPAPSSDGVEISSSAQAAAETSRLLRVTETNDDIRQDRVEAARAAIERGDFKLPENIAEVAKKISRYV
jgi:anti-sigma28 factor (negative regulator of flagellin synthesis)